MRPERASCGPLREVQHGVKASIRKGAGHGYQNLLERLTSTFLLEALQPLAIFSADDHDYCEHVHSYGQGQHSREVTVKSISTSTGVERPGVLLLSLWAPNGRMSASATYAHRLCLLPNQSFIYWRGYFPLTIISLFLLVYVNTSQNSSLSPHRRSGGPSLTSGGLSPHDAYGKNVLGLGISPNPASARPSPALWLRSPTRPNSHGVPGMCSPHSPLPSPLLVPPTLDQDDEDEHPQTITVHSYRRPSFLTPASPLSSTWAETPVEHEKFADADEGGVRKWDLETGPTLGSARSHAGLGVPSCMVGPAGVGRQQQQQQQARRATWGFRSESEREKDKRMERQGNWGAAANIAGALTPNLGEGITSLASGTGTAAALVKQFVIGRGIAGGFWRRLAWDLMAVAWPPLLVLAGIVTRLTH